MNLSLRQLEVIVAIADSQSFTRAAAAMHLSQSAASHAVAEVERQLGFQIFDRTTRSVQLTRHGRDVVAIARSAVSDHQHHMGLLDDAARGAPETLTIAAMLSVTASLLPRALSDLALHSPRSRFQVWTGNAQAVVQRLVDGLADVAIAVEDERVDGLTFTPVMVDEFVCLFKPDHHLAHHQQVTWKQLTNETLIAFSAGSSLRRATDTALAEFGGAPESIVEATDAASAAGLASAGFGVMVASDLLVPLTTFAGLLHRRIKGSNHGRQIGVFQATGRPMTSSARHLVRALRRLRPEAP